MNQTLDENVAKDPVFIEEQQHLTDIYAKIKKIGADVAAQMEAARKEAALDKQSMSDELFTNLATFADAMETYADIEAMNRIIESYNLAQGSNERKLADIALLLKQPYFAKISIALGPNRPAKDFYIGNTGLSDESCRRMIVDWRSPIAELYYNQDNGKTSYEANGRTIDCELLLRRQFDIAGDTLNNYFDTTVAIRDSLLLASLTKRRSARMQAITTTIQREQNLVIRHEDAPTLLVNGIAGSGKTSVLMQRIAYLFYKNRESLDPSDVYLISPNPVFSRYIDSVLPDMGEANPNTLTWTEFAKTLLPRTMGAGSAPVEPELLDRIDEACTRLAFEPRDFKDIVCADTVLLPGKRIAAIAAKFPRIQAGPHLVTLVREEILQRLEARIKQMSGDEEVWNEVADLSIDEQLRLFRETIAPQTEQDEKDCALVYLKDKYADAFAAAENDEWLRIDRIAKRLLGQDGIPPTAWLYLKIAITGLSNARAKYVMVDEVQDYSVAQLAVLARYFRRAHFLLLGDRNQAIAEGTAAYEDIRALFEKHHGPVSECRLNTSYRSTPGITELFASLLSDDERMDITSVQRNDTAPVFISCSDEEERLLALKTALRDARDKEGLTAVIVPFKQHARRLQAELEEDAPTLIADNATLPNSGTVILPLKLAKGLEFDRVIVADASAKAFPDNPLSRRRLYTTLSRATKEVTVLSCGPLTPLLKNE